MLKGVPVTPGGGPVIPAGKEKPAGGPVIPGGGVKPAGGPVRLEAPADA